MFGGIKGIMHLLSICTDRKLGMNDVFSFLVLFLHLKSFSLPESLNGKRMNSLILIS